MAILAINLQERFFSQNILTVLPIGIFSKSSVLSESFLIVLLFDIKICVRFLIFNPFFCHYIPEAGPTVKSGPTNFDNLDGP